MNNNSDDDVAIPLNIAILYVAILNDIKVVCVFVFVCVCVYKSVR